MLGAALAAAFPAAADDPVAPVEVVDVGGPIDRRMADFVAGVISGSDAQLVVLQVDSVGAVDGDVAGLIDLVAAPPVPVAVWVGPAPATARGAAAQLLAAAGLRGVAPGSRVGYLAPTVAGGRDDAGEVAARFPEVPDDLVSGSRVIREPVPGIADLVSPGIGQFVAALDGAEIQVGDRVVVLDTATRADEEGVEVIRPLAEVRFRKPGIVDRTLRLAVRPEAAFFFLVAGLALVAFEFYAIGPGVAAAVGVISLLLAGYGLAVLPTNWWAVAAVLAGTFLFVFDVQRNGFGLPSLVGTGLLVLGGLTSSGGAPQIRISWWPVALVALGALLFFGFAMTTVMRSRFSTLTIGREHLIDTVGIAESALDPVGIVLVDGARWRAIAPRTARVAAGDRVRVSGVEGISLRVEPEAGPDPSK